MVPSLSPVHILPTHTTDYTPSEIFEIFKEKLQQITIKPECDQCEGCGRSYIQLEKLRHWLKEKSLKRASSTWADLCLQAGSQGYDNGSLSLKDINMPGRESLLVFSILYDMGASGLIEDFQRWEFEDNKLPINVLVLEAKLKEKNSAEATLLAEKFDKRQWTFCPAKFDDSRSFDCEKSRIVPICKRGLLSNKGGTSVLWQIAVQEEFVGEKLRQMSVKMTFTDPTFGVCYQFALRTFRNGHAEYFEAEREAFWALRENDGMIRYLGDFSHPSDPSCQPKQKSASQVLGDSSSHMTDAATASGEAIRGMSTNILVEWDESDLEDFFAWRQPPILASEVELFWKELFDVAEALRKLHNFKKNDNQEFDGWHADIKPENILRVQSSFKLSVSGFARFRPSERNNTAQILGGTLSYGSPEMERCRKNEDPVPQAIDIWSLGCVFSMAASWIVLGYNAIPAYEKFREDAVKAGLQNDEVRPEGDFFHDGWNVLHAIQQWHDALRPYIRQTDAVTGQVLDLVTNSMLLGDPGQRISAFDLCASLMSILDSCPETPDFGALTDVQAAFDEIRVQNEELLTRATGEPNGHEVGSIQGRTVREAPYDDHIGRTRSNHPGARQSFHNAQIVLSAQRRGRSPERLRHIDPLP